MDVSVTVEMVQGEYYPIKIWFSEGTDSADIDFKWSYGAGPIQTVPASAFYTGNYIGEVTHDVPLTVNVIISPS